MKQEAAAISEVLDFLNYFGEKYYPLSPEQLEEIQQRRLKYKLKKKQKKTKPNPTEDHDPKSEEQNQAILKENEVGMKNEKKEEHEDVEDISDSEESTSEEEEEEDNQQKEGCVQQKKGVKRFSLIDCGVQGRLFVSINDNIDPLGMKI